MVHPTLKTLFIFVIGFAVMTSILVSRHILSKQNFESEAEVSTFRNETPAGRHADTTATTENSNTPQTTRKLVENNSTGVTTTTRQPKINVERQILNETHAPNDTDANDNSVSTTTDPNTREFLIDTSQCQLQNIDPFDKTVLPLLHQLPPYQCPFRNDVTNGLVYLKDKVLYVNATVKDKVLKHHKANNNRLYCCVKYFKRNAVENNDSGYRSQECISFSSQVAVTDEYMDIVCYLSPNDPIYHNFDFAVLRKSHVEARCRAHEEEEMRSGKSNPDRLSVLVLGIDSSSRLGTFRYLPRTREVLSNMGAIEFVGHHRVAENTFPNMGAAMLAGKELSEMDRDCIDEDKFMDKCSFLWDHFGERGYRTAFVENMNDCGLFTLYRSGFHRQPADYYGRTFFNGMNGESKVPACYRGGTEVSDDEAVFQWGCEFQTEFARERHFGYFWISQFTHGYANSLQHVDDFLPRQLRYLEAGEDNGGRSLLNNTLLVFMSDHGQRYGDLLDTEVGKVEVNLPFLFLVFPPWFRRKYGRAMQRMRQNAASRLTSHFDVYATLRDIADFNIPGDGDDVDIAPSPARAMSFFYAIPENRTCNDAGISDAFCTCIVHNEALPSTDSRVAILGKMAVNRLNEITLGRRKLCAKLHLKSLKRVVITKRRISDISSPDMDAYFGVTVVTSPGDGIFAMNVNYNGSSKSYVVGKVIMRLNEYGNSSACVRGIETADVVSICFCVEQPSSTSTKVTKQTSTVSQVRQSDKGQTKRRRRKDRLALAPANPGFL